MVSIEAQKILIEKAVEAAGGKQALLAERLGCAQQTVSKLLTGEIRVTADWALRIDRATTGRVPATAWFPELAAITAAPSEPTAQVPA